MITQGNQIGAGQKNTAGYRENHAWLYFFEREFYFLSVLVYFLISLNSLTVQVWIAHVLFLFLTLIFWQLSYMCSYSLNLSIDFFSRFFDCTSWGVAAEVHLVVIKQTWMALFFSLSYDNKSIVEGSPLKEESTLFKPFNYRLFCTALIKGKISACYTVVVN